jgi:hypothetical protein
MLQSDISSSRRVCIALQRFLVDPAVVREVPEYQIRVAGLAASADEGIRDFRKRHRRLTRGSLSMTMRMAG